MKELGAAEPRQAQFIAPTVRELEGQQPAPRLARGVPEFAKVKPFSPVASPRCDGHFHFELIGFAQVDCHTIAVFYPTSRPIVRRPSPRCLRRFGPALAP